MKTYVVGHKNPDTDSVVSAIVLSSMKEGTIATVAGDINKETEYLLKRFGFDTPVLLPSGKKEVILVDTNNPDEFADNLTEEDLVAIVDHHKMGGVATAAPIEVSIRVVGSTNTVLYLLGAGREATVSKEVAGIMIGAIVSDTLNLTSPTTTDFDKKAIESLNKIANIDVQQLANEMFAAKSDISDISTAELLTKDYKILQTSGKKLGVGVWETVKPETIMERKSEILDTLQEMKQKEGLDYIIFASVDILRGKSDFFVVSEAEQNMLEAVYGVKTKDSVLTAEGVVSRKKQMNPQFTEYVAR